jgi:hypothetical protein
MFEGMWGRERRQPAHYTKNYPCCAARGMKCAEITVIRGNSVVVSAKRPGYPQIRVLAQRCQYLDSRDYGFMWPAFQLVTSGIPAVRDWVETWALPRVTDPHPAPAKRTPFSWRRNIPK